VPSRLKRAPSGKFIPTFRDNLSVPSPMRMWPIGCPEMSLRDNPEQRSSYLFRGGA
jgi:hypothetical protein